MIRIIPRSFETRSFNNPLHQNNNKCNEHVNLFPMIFYDSLMYSEVQWGIRFGICSNRCRPHSQNKCWQRWLYKINEQILKGWAAATVNKNLQFGAMFNNSYGKLMERIQLLRIHNFSIWLLENPKTFHFYDFGIFRTCP